MVTTPSSFPSDDVSGGSSSEITDTEFQEQLDTLYDQWRDGDLPYVDVLTQVTALKQDAEARKNLVQQGNVEMLLGIMQGYRGDLDAALSGFKAARQLFNEAKNRDRVISSLLNIGETYRLKGNFTYARRFFHVASETAQEINAFHTQTLALANEGQILISMGHHTSAREILEQALVLSLSKEAQEEDLSSPREVDRWDTQCEIHYALVEICLAEKKLDVAWKHATQALHLAEKLDYPLRIGFANRALAQVITELDEIPDDSFSSDPDTYFKMAVAAFREVKAEGEQAKTLYAQGKSLGKRRKRRRAARLFRDAMIIFTKLGMSDDAAKAAEAQLDVI